MKWTTRLDGTLGGVVVILIVVVLASVSIGGMAHAIYRAASSDLASQTWKVELLPDSQDDSQSPKTWRTQGTPELRNGGTRIVFQDARTGQTVDAPALRAVATREK